MFCLLFSFSLLAANKGGNREAIYQLKVEMVNKVHDLRDAHFKESRQKHLELLAQFKERPDRSQMKKFREERKAKRKALKEEIKKIRASYKNKIKSLKKNS